MTFSFTEATATLGKNGVNQTAVVVSQSIGKSILLSKGFLKAHSRVELLLSRHLDSACQVNGNCVPSMGTAHWAACSINCQSENIRIFSILVRIENFKILQYSNISKNPYLNIRLFVFNITMPNAQFSPFQHVPSNLNHLRIFFHSRF